MNAKLCVRLFDAVAELQEMLKTRCWGGGGWSSYIVGDLFQVVQNKAFMMETWSMDDNYKMLVILVERFHCSMILAQEDVR